MTAIDWINNQIERKLIGKDAGKLLIEAILKNREEAENA